VLLDYVTVSRPARIQKRQRDWTAFPPGIALGRQSFAGRRIMTSLLAFSLSRFAPSDKHCLLTRFARCCLAEAVELAAVMPAVSVAA
jgi:hypothetical protein